MLAVCGQWDSEIVLQCARHPAQPQSDHCDAEIKVSKKE
jgi:hypothetical protein